MERREKSSKKIILILFILFLAWITLQFLAPISLPEGSVNDLSGLTWVLDNKKYTDAMPAPWNVVYSVGDRLCHQKAERSFFINGNQMPFCSRCTATWLGLAIGLGVMVFYKVQLDEKFLLAILIGLVPMGIDGTGQLFGFWESMNITRVITGLPAGIVCGVAIAVIIDEINAIRSFKKTKSS